jgi:uroporphyrinogen-III synthase
VPADLTGFTVGVTADRRGDEQALMLRRLGVEVLRGPSVETLHVAPGDGVLRAQVEALIDRPPEFLVANTGLGIRSLFTLAAGWGREDDLRTALGTVRIAARGPKAAGAVRLAGLPVWWRAPTEQLDEVADHLVAEGVAGRRVVFQLHGSDRESLAPVLRAAGAEVTELELYRWTLPSAAAPALELIEACCDGRVDAVTFTAGPAVRNLVELADTVGRAGVLLDALNGRVAVVCVGPVCAAVAREEGLTHPLVPEAWRLGSMVRLVGDTLRARAGPEP